jgi:methylenetetrahydrofolate dehydrogenase (NADP+) / methenyltetrahydrofolate cyclohydrolase
MNPSQSSTLFFAGAFFFMTLLQTNPQLLDGKALSETLQIRLQEEVQVFRHQTGVTPGLRVVRVGDDPASGVYVRKKAEMAKALGMDGEVLTFPETITAEDLSQVIQQLNQAPEVHGILLQLPLPTHLNPLVFQEQILPEKDVDGFHPYNLGQLLMGGTPYAVPCTPLGVMTLLKASQLEVAGKHAVVLGRSNIVGKPQAQLLLAAHATVTIAHSRTQNLPALCQSADLLIAAVGKPKLVTASWVKQGAVVIDVGINRDPETGKLCGDVDFESVAPKSLAITPVPGGVGPMTIAMLMQNTLRLAEKRCLRR